MLKLRAQILHFVKLVMSFLRVNKICKMKAIYQGGKSHIGSDLVVVVIMS